MHAMKYFRALSALFIAFVLIIGTEALPKKSLQNGKVAALTAKKAPNERSSSQQHHRIPREIRLLTLKDPLDCLSQVVCGLNTYPPERPSVRTSTANDFAFLLKNAVKKLRSQRVPTTTTTTVAPATTKRTTPKAPLNDDDDDEEYDDDTIENDLDYEADGADDYYDSHNRPGGPPPTPIDRRRLKRSSIFRAGHFGRRDKSSENIRPDKKKNKKQSNSNSRLKQTQNQRRRQPMPVDMNLLKPTTLTPLDRLRMETNLRAKLLSDAQCANGLNDHTCPFNYQQMLSLISSSLERERTVSYTTNKVLPMVGYLIKSRNYTGTLAATFLAIERIDNYTIEADKEGKPVDFSHILDEVLNRVTGDNGLRIVDTSNDSASASVWEDDEFDHVLQNQYVRKRPESDSYKLSEKQRQKLLIQKLQRIQQQKLQQQKNKQKQKASEQQQAENDDQSTTSEEDTSEEGLVFDRPRPPPRRPHGDGPGDNDSTSEEDDQNQEDGHSKVFENGGKNTKKNFALSEKEKLMPPPVFGHLQRNAEDE